MCTSLFKNDTHEFVLKTGKGEEGCRAKIVRRALQGDEEVVIFDYCWPKQLAVEIEAGEGSLKEDGILCWQLYVTAHHVRGMAKGEFRETEWFEVKCPFGTAQEMVCETVDIVRKARFEIAERHLDHLPHQTWPPVDGRQGPYGHP